MREAEISKRIWEDTAKLGFCVMFVSDSIKIVGRAIGPKMTKKKKKKEREKEISFRTFDLVFYDIV